jgi:hypothetical protein
MSALYQRLEPRKPMIERITAYKSSDGSTFATLAQVQVHEIKKVVWPDGPAEAPVDVQNSAVVIVTMKDKIIDILSTGPRSKPKARAINGGKKSRKPAGHPTHQVILTNPPTIEKLP